MNIEKKRTLNTLNMNSLGNDYRVQRNKQQHITPSFKLKKV